MSTNSKVEGFIDALRNRILSGEFGGDGRLPSFRTLATEYSTTQETMNKTMQALQAEGLLTSMGAKGVFVNTPKVRLLGFVPNFYEYLQEQKLDPLEEYIEKPVIIKAPIEVAEAISNTKNLFVMRRFKIQKNKNVVFRIEETFYPKHLITESIQAKMLKSASYVPFEDLKAKFGLSLHQVNERVLSRLPSLYEQKLLKIVRTNPVIDIKRTSFSKDRKSVIYYQHLILNANLFFLSYDLNFSK
jgi:DNA-binding GntR family transcriptional regulator